MSGQIMQTGCQEKNGIGSASLSGDRKTSGLLAKIFRGGAWLGLGNVSEQALRFIRNMILARLLAPEAFGLMAIVLSISSLFQVVTGIGLKEAIIQNARGGEASYLNGAWWLSVGRGLVLYAAGFLAAPFLASYFEASQLTVLLRIAFLNILAQSALSPGAYLSLKEMKYFRWVSISQGGSILGIATTILLAWKIQGPLALAIGYAVEAGARCLLSFVICPYRPRLMFDPAHVKSLLRFAGGMFGLPVLMLVYTEGATFVVGKTMSKHDLGLFAMALTVARLPTAFGSVIVDLLIPAFSQIQNDLQRLNRGVLKVTTVLAAAGVPAITFVILYRDRILECLYGPNYSSVGLCLAILFINEWIVACSMPIASVYLAMGKPGLLRRFSFTRAMAVLVLIYPAAKYGGLAGAACTPLIAMIFSYGLQLVRLRQVTGIDLAGYGKIFLRALMLALPVIGLWWLAQGRFQSFSPKFAFAAIVLIQAVAVLAAMAFVFVNKRLAATFFPYGLAK